MAGMLQILTYLLSFYLVIKGIEILQIALCSNREKRAGVIALGIFVLIACVGAGIGFSFMQDKQAKSMSRDR
jgi:F0F1-type ATP synthase membrane subunit c/vacuolar-type H+-ATPase subunit K